MCCRALVFFGSAMLATSAFGGTADAGFRFTVTADPQGNMAGFGDVLAAINDVVGGPGAFHVTAGDMIFYTGDISNAREVIDQYFGNDYLWYPLIGNHDVADIDWLRDEYNNGNGMRTPLKEFTNRDGPPSAEETTFTWDYANVHFVFLNEYWDGANDTGTDGDVVPALYDWLAADLAANRRQFTFVFGHEPAFPYNRHVGDSLDAYPEHRDAFWQLLEDHDVGAYVCGHTHYYSKHRGDESHVGKVWQINPAAAGFGLVSGPEMFLDVTVEDARVTFSAYEDSGGWHLIDTIVIGEPSILARHVFYNNSAFDDPARGLADHDAVAPDPDTAGEPWLGKTALLPGQTASFRNCTSYDKGINGIAIDIAGLPSSALSATNDPDTSDLGFRLGNDEDPAGWRSSFDPVDPVPLPRSVSVVEDIDGEGTDRVMLIWDDYAILGQWLQVTVRATEKTGLADEDVFYFGSAPGEAGDSDGHALVNTTDEILARSHPRSPRDPAAIDNPYDYNRDGLVDVTDRVIAREHRTGAHDVLRLITAPGGGGSFASAAATVPEPSSLVLLTAAAVGFIAAWSRRRRRAA